MKLADIITGTKPPVLSAKR